MGGYLMGVDSGGTVTKAALYDTAGKEVAVAGARTEMLFPSPRARERDSEDLWAANVLVISSIIEEGGHRRERYRRGRCNGARERDVPGRR